MDAPFPITCTNCHDKQLKCKAHHHSKGSCYHCIVNGLQCLIPSLTIPRHGPPGTDVFPFQCNCFHCTQSHQTCLFNANSSSQCKRCMKLEIPCLFKLSSQGCCNDLIASPTYANQVVNFSVVNDCSGGKQKTRLPVWGNDGNKTTTHDDNGDDDAGRGGGEGDRMSRFDGVHWRQIRGLVAERRQSHLEADSGNVPAGLHGGDDNSAAPPPPQDQGSRRWSIIVSVAVLGIPS